MSEITKVSARLVTVEVQDGIDCFDSGLVQRIGISLDIPCPQMQPPPMQLVKVRTNRAISPSLQILGEKLPFIPNERPRLAVIHQFLKLPRRHASIGNCRCECVQDVGSNIPYRSHDLHLSTKDATYPKSCRRALPTSIEMFHGSQVSDPKFQMSLQGFGFMVWVGHRKSITTSAANETDSTNSAISKDETDSAIPPYRTS